MGSRRVGRGLGAVGLALALLVGMGGAAGAKPAGWRFEGTAGAEVAVPGGWSVNDYGCGMSGRPTVVRAEGMRNLCYTEEPADKEVALIGYRADVEYSDQVEQLTGEPVVTKVSGVAAERLAKRLPDGRYAGRVRIPSRDLVLVVRTLSETRTRRILDGFRLARTDAKGCPTESKRAKAGGVKGAKFVPAAPASVSLCYFAGGEYTDPEYVADLKKHGLKLAASHRLKGAKARALATALSKARPGPNKDAPKSQCADGVRPVVPDLALIFRDKAGKRLGTVFATFQSCKGRRLDNGKRKAKVTEKLLFLMMDPLKVGYSWSALPAAKSGGQG
ncbi:hypothetical protein [Actinocorallia herbida]|nr:hypothetical protein [Actinocorallia herbida]